EVTTLALALAVAYDRDEQLSSAFQTLDHMQSALTSSYAAQLQQSIGTLQFVPAIDQRYWQALFYESAGFLAEARAEWLNYAAGSVDPDADVARRNYEREMQNADNNALLASSQAINPRDQRRLLTAALRGYENASLARPDAPEPHFRAGLILRDFFVECSASL